MRNAVFGFKLTIDKFCICLKSVYVFYFHFLFTFAPKACF